MTALLTAGEALLSISDRFRSTESSEDLIAACREVLGEVGSYHFAMGIFNRSGPEERTILGVDYPEVWVTHYFANGYIDIDPTVTATPRHSTPYDWDFAAARRSKARRLFNDIYDLGVRSGLTVPIHGPGGSTFVASFAATAAETSRSQRALLTWIAAQFYEHYIHAVAPAKQDAPHLTSRERDCLTWVARGKSSWDIGAILGISENTVNFHLKNAFAKLNARGRTIGVVKAITLGLIEP